MSFLEQINKLTANLTKDEALSVAKAAKKRIEELDKEKTQAVKMLQGAFHARTTVRYYGQDLHVRGFKFNTETYGYDYWTFELENGSVVVINVD